jgi:hypothetical protein
MRWAVLDILGYIFCGFALQWWKLFGCDQVTPQTFSYVRKVFYFIGIPSYRLGCFFYGLQDHDGRPDRDP